MNNELKATIKKLEDENQDYEFYPTDKRIVAIIHDDLRGQFFNKRFSILDIGAGDGNFFRLLKEIGSDEESLLFTKYAIEKSSILTGKMESDIFILGTDFDCQTLIDKEVDVTFCNPPYSDYVKWTVKIIEESGSEYIYMVIPERWKYNEAIQEAIRIRGVSVKKIGDFDFRESEYRQARTQVEILKIRLNRDKNAWCRTESHAKEAFEIWFDKHFKIDIPEENILCADDKKKEEIHNKIVPGINLIETLVELYNNDMSKLMHNYMMLKELDPELLKELGASTDGLKEGLSSKIKGLKSLYWHELFERLEVLTKRLTSKSRESLLSVLRKNIYVDFTTENIYAIILWAIKNSNKYFDSQLVNIYMEMSNKDNVTLYKSNHVFEDDEWRYNSAIREGKITHFKLMDYRLVLTRYRSIDTEFGRSRLSEHTIQFLNDLFVIAGNLGFEGIKPLYGYYDEKNTGWAFGDEHEFWYSGGILIKCRFYKNGNIHMKPNQEFIKKLNIEAARILGWIKSPREAAEEMDIKFDEAESYFGSNIKIASDNIPKLIEG